MYRTLDSITECCVALCKANIIRSLHKARHNSEQSVFTELICIICMLETTVEHPFPFVVAVVIFNAKKKHLNYPTEKKSATNKVDNLHDSRLGF